MSNAGIFHWQEKVGKTNPHVIDFSFQITAAKTITPLPTGTPVLTAFDAIATQATIDDFLGTTNEFLVAAFDATAMGVDAFAIVVNMLGQAKYLTRAEAWFSTASSATPLWRQVRNTGLTASTLATEASLGANGNMAARFVLTGLDAATADLLVVRFHWIAK